MCFVNERRSWKPEEFAEKKRKMDRSQRDVNNNMVKRRIDDRDRDDDDDDGGSARKRPKFGHSDTSDVVSIVNVK